MTALASLLPPPRAVFYCPASGNGQAGMQPLAGGLVYTYVPGGTTPKTTWQDATETTPNANPIVLDAAGSCLLYGSGQYQITVTDSLGDAVPGYSGLTVDTLTLLAAGGLGQIANVAALRAATTSTLPQTQGALIGYYTTNDGGQGAFFVGANASDNGGTIINDASGRSWYRQISTSSPANVAWFGAKFDGSTDDTNAIAAAIAACPWIGLPQGIGVIRPGALTITREQQRISGICGLVDGPIGRAGSAGSALKVNGTGGAGLSINVQSCILENFAVGRTGAVNVGDNGIQQIRNSGSEGYVFTSMWAEGHYVGFAMKTGGGFFSYCVAQNNTQHGFTTGNDGTLNAATPWMFGCLSQNNGGWGFFNESVAVSGTPIFYGVGGEYFCCTSYNNAAGGWVFTGSTTSGAVATLNDILMDGCWSSYDGGTTNPGIAFLQTSGFNITLSNTISEYAGANGIECDSSTSDIIFQGCRATQAGVNGFFVSATNDIVMSGCTASENGRLASGASGVSHFGGKMILTGGRFFDGGPGTQGYGITSWDGGHFVGGGFDCTSNITAGLAFTANTAAANISAVAGISFINSGSATIAMGATVVTVTHGLASTPTSIQIAPHGNLGAGVGWWVDTLTSSSFNINTTAALASAIPFYWRAGITTLN